MARKRGAAVSPSPMASKSEERYRAEDDLRTLSRAEEIRGDTSRMAACERIHREQSRAIGREGAGRSKGRRGGRRRPRDARRQSSRR